MGGAVYCDDAISVPDFICCDIYGNVGGDWEDLISDQFGINGNISLNPQFLKHHKGNYFIESSSPCTPANNECDVLIGALGPMEYVCGDANGDGVFNILDLTFILNYLYKGGPPPYPIFAGDADGNGSVNILDVAYFVNFLYKGGPAPIC